jgi:hypothetical protein
LSRRGDLLDTTGCLGINQVKIVTTTKHSIHLYLFNEYKDKDVDLLVCYFGPLTKEETKRVTTKLFFGPTSRTSTI